MAEYQNGLPLFSLAPGTPSSTFWCDKYSRLLNFIFITPFRPNCSPRIRTKPEVVLIRIMQCPKRVDAGPIRRDSQLVLRYWHQRRAVNRGERNLVRSKASGFPTSSSSIWTRRSGALMVSTCKATVGADAESACGVSGTVNSQW